MYALRERRQHVTQEDFEFAVAKVRFIFPVVVVSIARCLLSLNTSLLISSLLGVEETARREHVGEQAVLIVMSSSLPVFSSYLSLYAVRLRIYNHGRESSFISGTSLGGDHDIRCFGGNGLCNHIALVDPSSIFSPSSSSSSRP